MAFSTERMIGRYDELMFRPLASEFYQQSQFYNFGYWTTNTSTAVRACEQLMDKLLQWIPEKKGSILDVACGMGATTSYLLNHYEPSLVTGINISKNQIIRCREKCPDCTFHVMDAVKCDFPKETFDNIICVEAAFHFNSREAFLQEALRLLKPGGRLVLSDIMNRRWLMNFHRGLPIVNYVPDLDAYRELYTMVGFIETEVVDATEECWTRFYHHFSEWRKQKRRSRQIGLLKYLKMNLWNYVGSLGITNYLLVCAKKK